MSLPRNTLERLSEILDLYHYLQPANLDEERERFLSSVEEGGEYNPEYEYRSFGEAAEARQLLEDLDSEAETRIEESVVASLTGKLRMIEAIGSEEITRVSRSYYGDPSQELVDAARRKISTGTEHGEEEVDGSRLSQAFDSLFEELDVDYGCEISPVNIIRNSPRKKRILIPSGKRYSRKAAKRLLIHESTHSIRTVNGLRKDDPALIYGTEGYEIVEEGLPTFNEEEVGVFADTLPKITARVIAVDSSRDSFHELYRRMRDLGLDRRASYVRAYRVKRGLRDTSQTGGFIKDHIYFQGYRYLSENPGAAEKLYVGKIGPEDLEDVEASPEVTRKEHISAYNRVVRDTLED
ncbi:MAG: DUF1704 domain-containing protein [Candidatus Nanohaloarchaea archaeon]|nr:DUF1704 domain-containing protein [Candidatus Nanohaloarchaea archaeon]